MLANQKDFPFAEKIVNAMNVYETEIKSIIEVDDYFNRAPYLPLASFPYLPYLPE